MNGSTVVVSASTDDAPMNTSVGANTTAGASLALPFTFNFDGANYTFFSASPDGWVSLSNSAAAGTASFTNTTTLATNAPKLYPFWDDLATGTTGSVRVVTTGTAPNRIFKVQWNVTIPRATSGAPNSTFQLWMYETTSQIEFRYGTMGTPTSGTISGGITGSTGVNFNSITFSSNTSSNSSANDVNTIAPSSGTMYTFAPSTTGLSFAWAPAASVVSPASQNTATVALSSTQVFTVTATNSGCPSTASVTVTVDPLTCSPATFSSPRCAGSNFTVTANRTGGGAPFNYSWSDGVGGVYPNAATITANLPAGTYTFSCNVTDACSGSCNSSVSVTVNALPSVAITPNPANSKICGTGNVILTAGGASTYSWTPTTGLTPTTGSPVTATPSSTTSYTVTGTDANGCTATAGQTVTVGPAITLSSVTATPPVICTGGNSQLNAVATANPASNYTVASIPVVAETPTGTPVVLATGGNSTPAVQGTFGLDDGYWDGITLPFNFTFYGNTYSTVRIGTNGNAQFGAVVDPGRTWITLLRAHGWTRIQARILSEQSVILRMGFRQIRNL